MEIWINLMHLMMVLCVLSSLFSDNTQSVDFPCLAPVPQNGTETHRMVPANLHLWLKDNLAENALGEACHSGQSPELNESLIRLQECDEEYSEFAG
jgi:hypothetical protein